LNAHSFTSPKVHHPHSSQEYHQHLTCAMEDYTMTARLLQSGRQVSRTEIKKIESTITDMTIRANFEKALCECPFQETACMTHD